MKHTGPENPKRLSPRVIKIHCTGSDKYINGCYLSFTVAAIIDADKVNKVGAEDLPTAWPAGFVFKNKNRGIEKRRKRRRASVQ